MMGSGLGGGYYLLLYVILYAALLIYVVRKIPRDPRGIKYGYRGPVLVLGLFAFWPGLFGFIFVVSQF